MAIKPADLKKWPTYRIVGVERTVKVYPVTEAELKAINLFTGVQMTMTSIFGFALSYLLQTLFTVVTTTDAATKRMGNAVCWICGISMLVAAMFFLWAKGQRKQELENVIRETEVVKQ